MSSHYNEIKEKRQILRDIYGGMMTIADLTRELGYGSPKSARAWLATVGVEAVRACLKSFDKNGGVEDNREKTSGSWGKCINIQVISAGKNIS